MKSRFLSFDLPIVRDDFGRRPFRVRHSLAFHPLFSFDRMAEVAKALPDDRVEKNGDGTWTALKNVERVPELGVLLDALLDEVAVETERLEPGMKQREGFVFVSAPGAVTPYHMDPEHNFLLQIRGTKTVHLFDGSERSILSERELEAFHTGAGRNLVYREELTRHARSFTLRPGDGLYFPVTHPHWVQNGGLSSVSFSITFKTPQVEARERLHKMNAKLRALGVPVSAVGANAPVDRVKLGMLDTLRAAKRLLGAEMPEAAARYG